MIDEQDDGIWTELRETVAIHHEEAFGALTTSGGLTRWLCLSAEIDARTGGLLVLGWDAKMARTSTVAILNYDAGGEIVWDWYADHGDLHAPLYWTVKPDVETGAVITLRQGPFKKTPEALMVMAEEAQTWRWYMCNLRTSYEGKMDMRKVRPL